MWRERVGQEGDRKREGETGVGDGESGARERVGVRVGARERVRVVRERERVGQEGESVGRKRGRVGERERE